MTESVPKAIVGLGNPGTEYARTRHNAGFWLADRLAELHRGSFRNESKFLGNLARVKIAGADVLLLQPATFMNRSGEAVQRLSQFYKIPSEDILIAYDDLDLPAGTVRLKRGGGHGGHNGARSVHQHLGEDYRRLRIGIGHPGDKSLVLNYVLGRPSVADEILIRAGIDAAAAALETWLAKSWDKATQQLHTPTPAAT